MDKSKFYKLLFGYHSCYLKKLIFILVFTASGNIGAGLPLSLRWLINTI